MPAVTFTEPEVARIGLNEREAKRQNVPHEVTCHELGELDRAIVDDAREGFVKVLTVPGRDRILGATIVAPRAGEMLGEFALAMRRGIGMKKLFSMIHAYPTYIEANRDAAGAWRRKHAPEKLLRWAGTLPRVAALSAIREATGLSASASVINGERSLLSAAARIRA